MFPWHFTFIFVNNYYATILENSVKLCHQFNKKSWLSTQNNKLQHSWNLDQLDLQYDGSKNDDHNDNITPPISPTTSTKEWLMSEKIKKCPIKVGVVGTKCPDCNLA